jgi:hypothetical protein
VPVAVVDVAGVQTRWGLGAPGLVVSGHLGPLVGDQCRVLDGAHVPSGPLDAETDDAWRAFTAIRPAGEPGRTANTSCAPMGMSSHSPSLPRHGYELGPIRTRPGWRMDTTGTIRKAALAVLPRAYARPRRL